MSRYNTYFNTHFSGCRLLATCHDPYRDREVQLRAIPGEFEVIGVTDGTDAWVAPVAGDPFRVNVQRLLNDLKHGKHQEHKPRIRVTVTGRTIDEQKEAQDLTVRALDQQSLRRRIRVHP